MSVYLQGYSQTLGLENFNEIAFTVSPNPVKDITTIEAGNTVIENVSVFNTLGQEVFTGTTEVIDLSNLEAGIYMAKITFEGNKTATRKLVKN